MADAMTADDETDSKPPAAARPQHRQTTSMLKNERAAEEAAQTNDSPNENVSLSRSEDRPATVASPKIRSGDQGANDNTTENIGDSMAASTTSLQYLTSHHRDSSSSSGGPRLQRHIQVEPMSNSSLSLSLSQTKLSSSSTHDLWNDESDRILRSSSTSLLPKVASTRSITPSKEEEDEQDHGPSSPMPPPLSPEPADDNDDDDDTGGAAAATAGDSPTRAVSASLGIVAATAAGPHPAAGVAAAAAPAPPSSPPLKATTMLHLQQKYGAELEYMVREFCKLERQLLGAKASGGGEGSGGAPTETQASRERREKLHAFIVHLQDTIAQIATGVQEEASDETKTDVGVQNHELAQECALSHLTPDKEHEECVQKLEEHILANLLPVKVRLKKQLAAQQGAKHNPVGMPRQYHHAAAATSDDADEEYKPRGAVAPDQTQYGKPLAGGGSSLTKKLHGPTLGSSAATTTVTATTAEAATATTDSGGKPKILFAGLAIGSSQMKSSVSAASTVHKFVIQDPELLEMQQRQDEQAPKSTLTAAAALAASMATTRPLEPVASDNGAAAAKEGTTVATAAGWGVPPPRLTADERRLLRRKKKRRLREISGESATVEPTNTVAPLLPPVKPRKKTKLIKKRGPRHVEYTCALCNETYNSTCDVNPWWALAQHECPKCRKMQVPRIDIAAPANAIEYHPALLAHVDENNGCSSSAPAAVPVGAATAAGGVKAPDAPTSTVKCLTSDDDAASLGSDLSDDDMDGMLSSDSMDTDESDLDPLGTMSPAEQAEHERFGLEYTGPTFAEEHAARLLTLMSHASTCPCQHQNAQHKQVCRGIKWMMLHVRDCPGTTATFDVCPFPWCRKTKHLLYHMVSCDDPANCGICGKAHLTGNLRQLQALNKHRLQRYSTRMAQKMRAAARARAAASQRGGKPAASKPRAAAAAAAAAGARAQRPPVPASKPAAAAVPTAPSKVVSSDLANFKDDLSAVGEAPPECVADQQAAAYATVNAELNDKAVAPTDRLAQEASGVKRESTGVNGASPDMVGEGTTACADKAPYAIVPAGVSGGEKTKTTVVKQECLDETPRERNGSSAKPAVVPSSSSSSSSNNDEADRHTVVVKTEA